MKVRIPYLLFFLMLFASLGFSQTPVLDSLTVLANQSKGLEKISVQNQLAEFYLENNASKTLELVDELLASKELELNSTNRAKALFLKARASTILGDYKTAYPLFNEAQKIYGSLKDEGGVASCHIGRGMAHTYQSHFDEAAKAFAKSLEIYLKIDDKLGEAQVLHEIGHLKYQTDFRKINELAEKKVLLLLSESLGSTLVLNGGVNQNLDHKLNSIYANAQGRIIVSLFSSDLKKIQKVIDMSLQHHKKIAIIGRRAQRIVDIAIADGYLDIPKSSLINFKFIDDKNKNDDPNIVALVTGNRHEPFFMLQRMCKKVDRLIHITDQDTVVLMTPPVPGTEKMAARTLDILYRSDASVENIDKRLNAIGAKIKRVKS